MPSVYIKTYGCQMNERDSEAVAAQLVAKGYTLAPSETGADVILLNTCSVRDMAEQKALHKMEVNLFTQMVVTSLLTRHRILTQVAAHGLDTLKILPPLMITPAEVDKFIIALDAVLRDCRKFPGPLWDLGANFLRQTLRKPAPVS